MEDLRIGSWTPMIKLLNVLATRDVMFAISWSRKFREQPSPIPGVIVLIKLIEGNCLVILSHFDMEAFSAKVTLAEDVTFESAVAFCIGVGIIIMPKFSMFALLVRLTTYLPSDGEVNNHPVSKFSTTVNSPGARLEKLYPPVLSVTALEMTFPAGCSRLTVQFARPVSL